LAKNKLKKFNDLETFSHVIQPSIDELRSNFNLKGNWRKHFFKNDNPIVLELGCGKGEYTVGLAKNFPEKNYLGIDIKGARIWAGASQALEEKLINVGFLRIRIDWIEMCFNSNEVDEIWITFPDPQIKKNRTTKRLTHPIFLKKYNNILKSNSKIHLKTDSQFLHGFTLGVIAGENHTLEDSTEDLYNSVELRDCSKIQTFYENMFLNKGMPITYLRFLLNY
jgi:tRNA (guanine-N7-)-methyltransferase|tara:strand:- start:5439 stop:6107 length:669 start_codon:yes stop_codon:yes gene_type:complete